MTAHPEPDLVTADLAELRRLLDVRTARVDGQLALLAQRSEQHARDADEVHTRVTRLEHTRWPLPSLAALTGLAALAVALWQVLGR
ncbi:hypothetical protein AB0G60_29770 [Streptomyces angustmyceticus]|uniref:Uncharacterized protein n=1 Tax=Streptomyces angustmyceticus TaxID=285578 RepID=A0A5J4LQJ0_9ACTN|nr:hypothetical protein [Streptomyces angustmyceticus]UAL70097.1 hypothetical protein K7396_29000 [Streptomyces angustmyceticus]GES33769.1 hypothetical protein San01_62570 [Streptomyces angustmyceticus]